MKPSNPRAAKQAAQRVDVARERLLAMPTEQRLSMTAERLTASFGLTPYESAQLLQAYGGR